MRTDKQNGMDQQLLEKYIAGEASENEMKLVIEWIEADKQHKRDFMALRKLHDITLWNKLPEYLEENVPSISFTGVIREVLKIAAVFVIVSIGAYYWFQHYQVKQEALTQTIVVPEGQHVEVNLPDGSKVWLNSHTIFTYPALFSSHSRNVTLNGEGYFKVAHDASRPFTINTDRYKVCVLGTEFNVIAYSEENVFETDLLKGSVEVSSTLTNERVRLRPGRKLKLEDGRLVMSERRSLDYFRWREGLICFDNESVDIILKKLERYYDVKIKINNTQILTNRYTGKFRFRDGIEHMLKVLQLSNTFTFTKDDDNNLIVIN